MKKKVLFGVLIILVLIQFIRPERNVSTETTPDEIGLHYAVSDEVQAILKRSCYDCHSNHTVYPWYTNIQPIGWWMQHHVDEAKRDLNFSVFGSYKEKKAKHKFDEIEKAANEGSMPLTSYTLIHRDTKLSSEQAKVLATWAGALK
jgi:hypothetical protein